MIPMDEMETRFQLERRGECEEEEKRAKTQSGYRAVAEEKLDCNQETILIEDEKVVGGTNVDEDGWKESFEQMGPGLPILKDPLPTGLACCLTRCLPLLFRRIQNLSYFYSISRLIQRGLETVTFYLSGLAQVVPLACTERWLKCTSRKVIGDISASEAVYAQKSN